MKCSYHVNNIEAITDDKLDSHSPGKYKAADKKTMFDGKKI